MNRMFVLLLGSIVSITASGQQAWIKYASFGKKFVEAGSIASYVRHIDQNTMVGSWDNISIFDQRGIHIITTLSDSNTIKKVDTAWHSAGAVSFSHSHSAVYWRDTLYGDTYIGVGQNDSVGILSSNIMKLNQHTGRYERVSALAFDSKVDGMMLVGDSTVFVWGVFYEARDSRGTRVYNGAALWDMRTNTLEQLPDSAATVNQYPVGLGSIDKNQAYESSDGTLFIIVGNGYRYRIIRRGSLQWQESHYPPVPAGGRCVAALVSDSDHIYVAWQKDSLQYPCYLLALDKGQWSTIARFSARHSVQTAADDQVTSISSAGSMLYLAGTFDLIDDDVVGPLVRYDLTTGHYAALPQIPFVGMEKSWIGSFDHHEILFETNGSLASSTQSVFMLRDTAAVIPTFTGPAETQPASFTITGTAGIGAIVRLYQVGSAEPTIAVADAAGVWSVPMNNLAPALYQFYATSVNADGWESPQSALFSVRVGTVTGVDPVPVPGTPEFAVFPNPARNSVTVRHATEVAVYTIDGRDVSSSIRIRRDTQSCIVDVTQLSAGIYLFQCVDTTRKKHAVPVCIY